MLKSTRPTTILHLCSFLILLYSFSMLFPILMGLVYGEDDLSAFLITFVLAFSLGLIGWWSTRKGAKALQTHDGFLVVILFWVTFSAVSTLPFYLDDRLGLTLTDALFEGVSGITTTGASILQDIDGAPKSILYYRAQLNFIGGLGVIVLAIAILPFLGIGGSKLYKSEMPGPLKEEKIAPRLADTAKYLWMIYTTLAITCGLSYYLAGMDWFNALCYSLSTVAIGGFAPHGESIGYFNSASIELISGVFNILSALNFALYFVALTQRSIKPILTSPEFRFFISVLGIVVGITCIELYRTATFGAQGSLVHGFFQAVSIMTGNGLGAGNYPAWPAHIALLLIVSSFFGGCVGSTCGGIKAMRFLLLYRQATQEIAQLIHPNAVLVTKVGGRAVPDRALRSVWGFFFLYCFFACTFVWILVALGHDLPTAFGSVAAGINNMGVGYGDTASGFYTLHEQGKWLMCLAMLMGRLEILPILVVFSRPFWRF